MEEHVAFIYDIDVDELRRNQGVGSRALALLEGELRGRQVVRIGLHVWADNPGAQALYRKVDYLVTSTHTQKSLAEVETVDQLNG